MKMLTRTLFVLVGFLSLNSSSSSAFPSKAAKTIELGHGYILLGENAVTYSTAKSLCDLAGKELVSIQTQEEDELILFLLRNAGFMAPVWTSGTNNGSYPYLYRWSNEAPMFHTRWFPTYPKLDLTYCIILYEDSYDRLWYTTSCGAAHYPLCENKTTNY